MRRSARSLEVEEPEGFLRAALTAAGAAVGRNPTLAGGVTAFLVATSYVSANALWYQPFFHEDAFFATRARTAMPAPAAEGGDTTIRIERAEAVVPRDPAVERVQAVLRDLGHYGGAVDGLAGPATRSAVVAYQRAAGLPETGEIDEALLRALDTGPATTAAVVPRPSPRRFDPAATPSAPASPEPAAIEPATIEPASAGAAGAAAQDRIARIQAGLRAFGNDGIEIDGKVGPRTRAAIQEFQALFGLPETGEPDEALYVKMREVGLTN